MDTPRPLVPLPSTGLHQRAGDLDRTAVCDQLSTHYAAGRLRPEELDARLGAAVTAETLLDLRRLVSDLPLAPTATYLHPTPPPVRVGWPLLDILALLAVIGCLGFAALTIVVLGVSGQGVLVAAGLIGGSVAALGGASLTHLAHRTGRRYATADQRPRVA